MSGNRNVAERAKAKRLKVAYLLSIFPKLSESFILNEIVELIKVHDVQILSWLHSSETVIPEEIKEYQLLNRTHYFTIKQIYQKNPFLFLNYFVKAMMHSLAVKRLSTRELKKDLKSAYFATVLQEKEIELIHAHFGFAGNYSIRLRRLLKKALIVVSFYGFDAAIADSTTYAELFKRANVITVLSNDMEKDLIRLGCSEKKIIIHHLGVDLNKFSYNERHVTPSEKIKFLCVGRFVEKKGMIYAIKAFSKLLSRHKNIELRIIGDGERREEIENLISVLEIQNEIILLGSHSHRRVIEEMHSSHIFILPSITAKNGDKEGTPTVLIEAQATGMPVISTYHAGIPEVVINGKTGYLVKEKDVNSLYKKMAYLVEHPELWNELGKNGRKHIEEEYNISKQVAILEEIYKRLLAKSEC